MAQDNYARDEAGNVWQVDAQGNAVRLVQQAGQRQSQPNIVQPNSARVAQQNAETQRASAAEARANQAAAAAQAKADRDAKEWAATHNPDGSPKPVASKNGSAELTAATRANAINAFTATRQLDDLINSIEGQYRNIQGYGNSGFTRFPGVGSRINTQGNKQFDAAGDAVRGAAITALGFTSGQTNTPREVEQNIGPYIPNSGDYDAVIQDKISRLKDLRDRARVQAVTVLGGVPNGSGQIIPLTQIPQQDRDRLFPPGTLQPLGFGGSGPSGGAGGSTGGTPPASGGGGSPRVGPRGEALLAPDEQVAFTGDARPIIGGRLNAAQESQVITALRNGDVGQAASIYERALGYPANRAELTAAAEQIRRNPSASVVINNANVDASAQAQADRAKFGDNLPAAMEARRNAPAIDTSIRQGVNGLTAGLADRFSALGNTVLGGGSYDENLMKERALTEADARLRPENSFLSNVVGGAAGAVATEGASAALLPARAAAWAPRIGDAVYGATAGYTNADPGQELSGAGVGALAGYGGGALGRGVTRGVGNVVGGARGAAADYLRDRGVPLTVGQLLANNGRIGRAVKAFEDAATSVPGVGDMINARRGEGLQAFNRAAFDEGMAPLGRIANPAPNTTGGVIGESGVDAALAARNQAYANTLDPVSVTADAPYIADTQATLAAGRALPANMQGGEGDIGYTLGTRVGQSFGQNGVLSGRDYQQALRGLRRDARSVENLPYGYDFGNVTRQAEGDLSNLLERQAPGAAGDLAMVNGANRNIEILRDAVMRARNGTRTGEPGVFAPSQLADAASANSRKFGGTQGTTRQPFFALSRAGQDILPSSIPDSGTARRIAAAASPAALAGIGGAGGYAAGDTQTGVGTGLALGALLAAGGTRNGQRLLTGILANRPDALRTLGQQINNRARIGGIFGAPLLLEATR